jgi:hypothetical protein
VNFGKGVLLVKVYGKFILVLMLSLALVGLSGCAEKEKDSTSGEEQKKTEEVKEDSTKSEDSATTEPKNEEKEVHDFVLKNTKIVQISNISRRVKEQYPDLGPFFVIRGMDERGEKSEIWIKDMKIFEMITTN